MRHQREPRRPAQTWSSNSSTQARLGSCMQASPRRTSPGLPTRQLTAAGCSSRTRSNPSRVDVWSWPSVHRDAGGRQPAAPRPTGRPPWSMQRWRLGWLPLCPSQALCCFQHLLVAGHSTGCEASRPVSAGRSVKERAAHAGTRQHASSAHLHQTVVAVAPLSMRMAQRVFSVAAMLCTRLPAGSAVAWTGEGSDNEVDPSTRASPLPSWPAGAACALTSDDSRAGSTQTELGMQLARPYAPCLLLPNVNSRPSSSSTAENNAPAATECALAGSATPPRTALSVVLPLPSWPALFQPSDITLPSSRTTSA